MDRETPYGNFNFLVDLKSTGVNPEEPLGGFSDVDGLETEMITQEYRTGVDRENHVRKIPGMHKVNDVTLKRGIVKSDDLWIWLQDVRRNGPNAKREVKITMRDEAGNDVESWILRGAFPLKYSGPQLSASGGGDVAMEQFTLCADGIVLEVDGNEFG